MNHMFWVVLLPFLGAICCFAFPERYVPGVGIAASLAIFAVSVTLLMHVWEHGHVRLDLGDWASPLGIGLYLDGLGALFLLLTAMVGVLVGLYAVGYFAYDPKQYALGRGFWSIWLLLWGGLNGVYLCSDVFTAYVLLEISGLAAVGLTVLTGSTPALTAGLRYLLAIMFSSLMYLLGVGLLYAAYGRLDFHALGVVITPEPVALTAFGLMVFGLLIKSALLPFHFWLPAAHSMAISPASAILSALVIKASFFLLLRIWFMVFPTVTQPIISPMLHPFLTPGQLLGVLGSLAMLWGALQAVRQTQFKLLIAYSTVSQMGYLFLLFALLSAPGAEDWSALTWTGTIFHAFSHGLAKAALLLAVGCLALALGTDDLEAMRDIAGRLPVVTFTLAVAGVSLMGLPPSAGFVAKWMLLCAALASGQWWWAVVIVLGSLLTAAYVFKILAYTFAPIQGKRSRLKPVPRVMTLSALTLAVLCALFGFRAEEVIALLPHAAEACLALAPWGPPLAPWGPL
jgi:formate hydrogenlyase subunit 3/multisubunit Na+/H+ antiporter MnhD subunit